MFRNNNPNKIMSANITNISTANGELRIWEQDNGKFGWATPNGSQGGDEASFDVAVKEAFNAEGLNATEYGY